MIFQPRSMTGADLDEVMAIETVIYPYPWTRGNFADSLKSGHTCWVLADESGIYGYCVVMHVLDEAHLLNLSIASHLQGQGLGRRLLDFLLDSARSAGAGMAFLEVRESNRPARALYDAVGFNEMAVRRNYYPAKQGREHAVLMGMPL